MNPTPTVHVGIDVAKLTLQIDAPDAFTGEINNTPKDIAKLLKTLVRKTGGKNGLMICCEATGPYTQHLVDACFNAGVRVCILNPANIRAYASAMAMAAKTDAIDARIIRRFAEHTHPAPLTAPDKTRGKLRQIHTLRDALTATLTRLQALRDSLADPGVRGELDTTIDLLKQRVVKLEDQIARTADADAAFNGLAGVLMQIQGVGLLTATKVAALVPELGTLGRRQAGALAGLAPHVRESGAFKGRRFIGGGRKPVRDALFMPATVAMCHNPHLRVVYQRLRAAGKPHKVALVALMRKLFIHMNRVAAAYLATCQECSAQPSNPLIFS